MKNYIVPLLFICCFVLAFLIIPKRGHTANATSTFKTYLSDIDGVNINGSYSSLNNLGFCYEIVGKSVLNNYPQKLLGYSEIIKCKRSDINRILEKRGFTLQDRYQIGDVLVFEGVDENGGRMQAAFSSGRLTIGSPVIFGSY